MLAVFGENVKLVLVIEVGITLYLFLKWSQYNILITYLLTWSINSRDVHRRLYLLYVLDRLYGLHTHLSSR